MEKVNFQKRRRLLTREEPEFRFRFLGLFHFFIKLASALAFGLVFALIGDELIGYRVFSFFFVLIALSGAFLNVCYKWTLLGVLSFNLIFFLIGVIMRMYLTITPDL